MKVHLAKFTPWQLRRCRQVQCRSLRCIQYGDTEVELSCVEQLVEISQAEFTEPLRFLRTFDCWGKKRMSRLFEVEFSFLSYLPVSSSCCLFLLFWTKHGFEVKWREKLPSGTLPIVRAWRKTTKTKRRKLALKRRKMALKQHKFLAETRKQQKQHFFSKQHFSLQTAKIITSLGNDTFSIFFCAPGCYRS